MADISPITVARFWSKVSVLPSDKACWEWKGSKNPDGYGNFRIPQYGRMTFGAHRVSYALYHGDFPEDGLLVRHSCDNPTCVNPYHLEKGTVKDNAQDKVQRGRAPVVDRRGERNGAAKLTEADVSVIKLRLATGEKYNSIATTYGVSYDLISRINLGKSWSHVQTKENLNV